MKGKIDPQSMLTLTSRFHLSSRKKMTKIEQYRQTLRSLEDWDGYLLRESNLPGPRGNLELAQAAAEEGDEALFSRYRDYGPEQAPVNTPQEFLAFCGVLGLWRSLASGNGEALETLRRFANDPRWRIREAVAMALQRWGDEDLVGMIAAVEPWSRGSRLEQRAAAAALCEPRLLVDAAAARRTLDILDAITASIPEAQDRKSEDFLALKKGLGYCWSVAVAALPEEGKLRMENWLASPDQDVAWIMKENLKKNRLEKMDRDWVAAQKARQS
jgi:hypothetical protein